MPNAEQLAIARLLYALHAALYALRGVFDALRAIKRPRFEFRVLIQAPREVVWRLCTADHLVLDGSPVLEFVREPLSGGDHLSVTHVLVAGQQHAQIVARELERDNAKGTLISQVVPHARSSPPEGGRDLVAGTRVEPTSRGTALILFQEVTIRSSRDRIVYPLGLRRLALLLKLRCECEPGPWGPRRAIQPGPQPDPHPSPAGAPSAMSSAHRAIALLLAVAVGIFAGAAGSAMLPTAFEREFDQDLAHYPLAASFAQHDTALRKLVLHRTQAAYNSGGWPAAQSALDSVLGTEVMVYADDEHVLAMVRHTLRVLGKLESVPSDCKAFMLTGARPDDFPEARQLLNDDLPIKYAVLQNGFDRKSRGVTFHPLANDIVADTAQSLDRQPVALSAVELRAIDEDIEADATQYCSGSIKRLVNLLARPPSEAARIERQLIYVRARDNWPKVPDVREALCRRHNGRPGGLACPQDTPVHTRQ